MDINTLNRVTEKLADVHPEMNIMMLRVFLFIAQRGEVTQNDVECGLNFTNSTASRNVSWWCSVKVYGKAGAGFIDRREDPKDRRYKLLRLTREGQAFYDALRAA